MKNFKKSKDLLKNWKLPDISTPMPKAPDPSPRVVEERGNKKRFNKLKIKLGKM